jgi:hypothetical protein
MFHLAVGYPLAAKAISASNLGRGLQTGMRSSFLLLGCVWLMLAVIAMAGTLAGGRTGRAVVLFAGLGLLAQIPVWVGMMGWFVGNEMILAASVLMVAGGLLLKSTS